MLCILLVISEDKGFDTPSMAVPPPIPLSRASRKKTIDFYNLNIHSLMHVGSVFGFIHIF